MGDEKPYSQADDVKDLVDGKVHEAGRTSAQNESVEAPPAPPPEDEDVSPA